jgi:phage baseplate assembly protein W
MATRKKEIVGLALPALRSQGGYFASKGKYDTAWGDVLLALLTPIGTRPGIRRFGSALHKVVFEPDIISQTPVVQQVVVDAITEWCPHVVLRNVIVRADGKTMQLYVSFVLKGDDLTRTGIVEVHRDKVIKALALSQGVVE